MARPTVLILVVAAIVSVVSAAAAFMFMPRLVCRDFSAGIVTYGNNQTLSVALARTPAEQQQGLAGCSSLPLGHGMYFIFPVKSDAVFWMKDMLMPIDIVWLSDNYVIGITPDVSPPAKNQASLPTYAAPGPVNGVLELGAGHAERLNIHRGSILQLNY